VIIVDAIKHGRLQQRAQGSDSEPRVTTPRKRRTLARSSTDPERLCSTDPRRRQRTEPCCLCSIACSARSIAGEAAYLSSPADVMRVDALLLTTTRAIC
jgi:hypothetical protein